MDAAVNTVVAAATIAVQAGDAQTGPIGKQLPKQLAVRVRDASNKPIKGVTITWAVVAGGAHASITASSLTDSLGIARAWWRLGTKLNVTQQASATASGLSPLTFTATGTLPSTAKIIKQTPTSQLGLAALPLKGNNNVCVRLSNGWNVEGATVTWAITAGGGSTSTPTSLTASTCRASTKWTMGPVAGTNRLEARVTGLTSAVYTVNAMPANRMWTGAVSTDWNTNGNWYPFKAPVSTDSIWIPAGMPRYPVTSSDDTTGSIIVSSGAQITQGDYQLYITGNFSGLSIGTNAGTVHMLGRGVTLRGNVNRLDIQGTVHLIGSITTTLITMQTTFGDTSFFYLDGHTARDFGPATFAGKVIMNYANDSLIVKKNATFKLATSRVNAGTVLVGGFFDAYVNVYPAGFYQGGGTNTLVLNGTTAQTVSGNPVFQNLTIANPAGVTFNTSVGVLGQVHLMGGSFSTDPSTTLDANGMVLEAGTVVNNNGAAQYNTLTNNGATINGNALIQK